MGLFLLKNKEILVKKLKIDILCTDGSPIGVCPNCLWGDNFRIGVGGAEYALLTMCELWARRGYTVRLYNSPHSAASSLFAQFPVSSFDPLEKRDVVIIFRTPNPVGVVANGLKVWWSCDQYTSVSFNDFSNFVDQIVCISPYHQEYFCLNYGIKNAVVIDLAVRLSDLLPSNPIPGRLIFTSVPDRGLQNLLRIYPQIKEQFPEVSLVITSDYRLWGATAFNERHRASWAGIKDVQYLGAVGRQRYLEELAKADIFLYPCIYDELFCISAAEAQCAGVYPVTTDIGALKTTVMGDVLATDASVSFNDGIFVERTAKLLSDRTLLERRRAEVVRRTRERFSPETILKQWDKVFNGT